jgi:hypothetical protein
MAATLAGFVTGGGARRLLLVLGCLLVLGLVAGLAAWKGYRAGFDRADADRRAEVAEIHAHHAEALADAERTARQLLQDQTRRGNELERQYLAATKTIAAQRRELTNRRIADASRDVDVSDGLCRLGPDWVRLYNEALGCDRGHAVPAAPPGAAGAAGTGLAADARILPGGGTVTPAVTPEDVLAHMRDYGARCRALEAQLIALIDWAEGGNPHAEAAP